MAERASEVMRRLASEVTCPLCLDIFTEPKRLPCDHVYCRECLRGLALRSTTGSISCPECRTDTPVPNFDVAVFTTPHQVNRLIEMYQNNLSLAETATATPQLATCGVHNSQPLALYCETCETLVCRDCVIINCAKKNHVHGFVDDMVEKYQTDLQRQMEPVKCLHQQISTALDNIVAADKELERKKEAKLRDIQSTFDAFTEIIECERRYLTESVKSSSQKQVNLNSAKRNEISGALEKLNDLIQYTETASLQESKLDFLQGIRNRKQTFNNVHEYSRCLRLHPATVPEVEVELLNPMDLKKLFSEKNFVYQKGDVVRGCIQTSVELTNFPALATSEVLLYLHACGGRKKPFSKTNVVASLCCCHRDSVQVALVKKVATDKYSLSFSPKTRGHHELHIKCNDTHICGGPIPVYVIIHPDQIMAAGKPEVTPLHNVAGIMCHGKQLILSQKQSGIVILDKSKVRTIPLPGVAEVLFDDTHIYATDRKQHGVIKMDMNGTLIKTTGREGNHPGEFDHPNGIRLSKDNEIFVCDSRNHRIQVFDKDLNLIRLMGRRGSGNGCFEHPDDLTFDERGNLYVADQNNNRIQVLTPQGEHVCNIGKCGKMLGEIEHPISVAIHKNLVYVTDCYNKRISVFKTTGEFVATFGEDLLTRPECIAIDENGYIHVTDGRSRLITF